MTGEVSILDQDQGLLDFVTGQMANTGRPAECGGSLLSGAQGTEVKLPAIPCNLRNTLLDPGDFTTNTRISRKPGNQLPTVDI